MPIDPAALRALVEQARRESRGRKYNEHSLYPKLVDGLAAVLDELDALRDAIGVWVLRFKQATAERDTALTRAEEQARLTNMALEEHAAALARAERLAQAARRVVDKHYDAVCSPSLKDAIVALLAALGEEG